MKPSSADRPSVRSVCRSLHGMRGAHSRFLDCCLSHTTRPFRLFKILGNLHHIFLILVVILCLGPVPSLAQPPPTISDLTADISRLAPDLGGEIFVSDIREGSSRHENSQLRNDDSILQRRGSSSSWDTSTGIPTPFDTISNNFANASCVSFFHDFLSNSTIMNCHAVSLLLENSNSFFHTLSSVAATSRVLDIACSEPVSECASIMTSLAEEMLQGNNCGQDYESNNPVVLGTYRDLMAYEPMYHASCLTNPDTQNYCFVDAVSNTTAPGDYTVYFIPLGSTLINRHITCNKCLQATMDVFAHWATVDGQPLDNTYIPSATRVNRICGAGFANTNVTVGSNTVTASAGLTVALPDVRVVSVIGLALGATLAGLF